jgi:hypothetical protein
MVEASEIREHMEIVGADGVHVGKVDGVENGRIKMTRKDEDHGLDAKHHHYVQLSAVASCDGGKVWLSAEGANARQLFEEEDGSPVRLDENNSNR